MHPHAGHLLSFWKNYRLVFEKDGEEENIIQEILENNFKVLIDKQRIMGDFPTDRIRELKLWLILQIDQNEGRILT